MSQTNYSTENAEAHAGMLADFSPRNDVLSLSNGEASAVGFGLIVVKGATADDFKLPTAAAAILAGATAYSARRSPTVDGSLAIEPNAIGNVLHVGRLYVRLEGTSAAIAKNGAVYVRAANPSAVVADDEGIGRIRADADVGDARLLSGVRVINDAPAGGYAILEIDPNAAMA